MTGVEAATIALRKADQEDVDRNVNVLDAIRPRHELRDIAGSDRSIGTKVGTGIEPAVAAQRENRAVAFAHDLELAFELARVVRRPSC